MRRIFCDEDASRSDSAIKHISFDKSRWLCRPIAFQGP